ncbi:hypothetical protein PilKf_01348 [Pillotina sp. SPG140]
MEPIRSTAGESGKRDKGRQQSTYQYAWEFPALKLINSLITGGKLEAVTEEIATKVNNWSRSDRQQVNQVNEIRADNKARISSSGVFPALKLINSLITGGKFSGKLEAVTEEIATKVNNMANGADQIDSTVNRVNEIRADNKTRISTLGSFPL